MAWIHLKAMRVFVESVLRYGLPVNFQGMILLPQKKTSRKLRDTLKQLYSHLDASAADAGAGGMDVNILKHSFQDSLKFLSTSGKFMQHQI